MDSFIANIEETAPEEKDRLTCQECGAVLEEVDEIYVCPNCSAQATNILQLDETELNYDDAGRVFGQRVKLTQREPKHTVDYGWAWSTDDAVVHILSLQVTALEKAKLIPDSFRDSVTNMWLKFWLENIAPYIKDEYDESELVPIDVSKALKLRDVEVLVKVKDKVMIPRTLMRRPEKTIKRRTYKAFGLRFRQSKQVSSSESSLSSMESDESCPEVNSIDHETGQQPDVEDEPDEQPADEDEPARDPRCMDTKRLNSDTVSILTLSRTLAFIEATARCTQTDDPLSAADIIRACNQYLIPFYDSFKHLPEEMKLNPKDKLTFQIQRPPTAIQISKTSSLLIHKIYHNRLPASLPTPNFATVLGRFMRDMNLPNELYDMIKDKVTFDHFRQTKPKKLFNNEGKKIPILPQYDRWVFAILLGHLKRLFDLSDDSILKQAHVAQNRSMESGQGNVFIFADWIKQMSLKLKLILSYDPFVLYHPLTTNLDRLETTPQVYAYIDTILSNRIISTTRVKPNLARFDNSYREELTQFLLNELPRPDHLDRSLFQREELDKSDDIKHPISDAIRRTRRFWINEDEDLSELIDRDFTESMVVTINPGPKWCMYDGAKTIYSTAMDVLPHWPDSFKLLLSVGSFLCVCKPRDLLVEVRAVEDYLYPMAKVVKRRTFGKRNN